MNAEQLERLGRNFKDAAVGFEAELDVGLNGVEALVLQFVSAKFRHEPDAATFLLLVNKDAGAFFCDAVHGELELLAAVAAKGAEDVSGEALRVNAHHGRCGVNVSHDQRDAAFYAAGGWRIA